MELLTTVITICILIMSVVLHELSHGYVAEFMGDPTPRLQGRLTVNPLKHLDPFGSVIVPLITYIAGGFTFGWAKPIEWNPYNVKNRRLGEFLISLAGPASNILIALVFGLVIRGAAPDFSPAFLGISAYIVAINITLAIFNLIPIPPLDGSKIFFSILPAKYSHIRSGFERYSIFLVLILIFFLWRFVEPVIPFLFQVITGAGY
jgi:Zn-dependent protease